MNKIITYSKNILKKMLTLRNDRGKLNKLSRDGENKLTWSLKIEQRFI